MLHRETVSQKLLAILDHLVDKDELKRFRLVGGTALALQEGHRVSIDLDFFGNTPLQADHYTSLLNQYGETKLLKKSDQILVYTCNGIKVDFVSYPYEWLMPPIEDEGYVLASKEDIGAMKINAILGRGSRKDFVDIYFLLKSFSLKELLDFFLQKYPEGSAFLALKSLTYFDDAEQEPLPRIIQPISWEEIKEKIGQEVMKVSL